MHRTTTIVHAVIVFVMFAAPASAQDNTGRRMDPFTRLTVNAVDCFSGTNLILHGSAFASTFILVETKADCALHNAIAGSDHFQDIAGPAAYIGYLAPVVIAGGLYAGGWLNSNNREIAAGSAALQALLVAFSYGTVLKAVTGRPGPEPGEYVSSHDPSRKFRFGLLRGGIHYGWPSGHAMTNVAVVSALFSFYDDNVLLRIAGFCYLGYLLGGVLLHEHNTMHWSSDILAGTLMGYSIGSTIGKNFRNAWNETQDQVGHSGFGFTPVAGYGYRGIRLSIGL